MKTKEIYLLKHISAFSIFVFFTGMMIMFFFTYFHVFYYFISQFSPIMIMLSLLWPHIALLILNLWLITFLGQKLEINKIFYRTMQAIAIIIFVIAFIILSLDLYIAYAYEGLYLPPSIPIEPSKFF